MTAHVEVGEWLHVNPPRPYASNGLDVRPGSLLKQAKKHRARALLAPNLGPVYYCRPVGGEVKLVMIEAWVVVMAWLFLWVCIRPPGAVAASTQPRVFGAPLTSDTEGADCVK